MRKMIGRMLNDNKLTELPSVLLNTESVHEAHEKDRIVTRRYERRVKINRYHTLKWTRPMKRMEIVYEKSDFINSGGALLQDQLDLAIEIRDNGEQPSKGKVNVKTVDLSKVKPVLPNTFTDAKLELFTAFPVDRNDTRTLQTISNTPMLEQHGGIGRIEFVTNEDPRRSYSSVKSTVKKRSAETVIPKKVPEHTHFCSVCKKGYVTFNNMAKHMERIHGILKAKATTPAADGDEKSVSTTSSDSEWDIPPVPTANNISPTEHAKAAQKPSKLAKTERPKIEFPASPPPPSPEPEDLTDSAGAATSSSVMTFGSRTPLPDSTNQGAPQVPKIDDSSVGGGWKMLPEVDSVEEAPPIEEPPKKVPKVEKPKTKRPPMKNMFDLDRNTLYAPVKPQPLPAEKTETETKSVKSEPKTKKQAPTIDKSKASNQKSLKLKPKLADKRATKIEVKKSKVEDKRKEKSETKRKTSSSEPIEKAAKKKELVNGHAKDEKVKEKVKKKEKPEVKRCENCNCKLTDPNWEWKRFCSHDCMLDYCETFYVDFYEFLPTVNGTASQDPNNNNGRVSAKAVNGR